MRDCHQKRHRRAVSYPSVRRCLQALTGGSRFPIVEATHSRISFMSLSLELREMVYDLVLISDETDENHFDPRNWPIAEAYIHNMYKRPVICLQQCETNVYEYTDYYGWKSAWTKQPALTRVSREVRAETLPIFYKKNEFVAFSDYPEKDSLAATQAFLRSIGNHNASLILHLTLLFPHAGTHEIIGEEVRKELDGESLGLGRASVHLCKGGDFASDPHAYIDFGWEYQGEELGPQSDEDSQAGDSAADVEGS